MLGLLDILKEITSSGISVNVCQTNGVQQVWFNNGFYKSDGCAVLFERDGELYLKTRYNQEDKITTIKDIITVSKEWWCFSRGRFDGWAIPHHDWVDLYDKI